MMDIDGYAEKVKYVEYRHGFIKSISDIVGNKTLHDEEQKKRFIELIGNSKDLKSLLIDNEMMQRIDEIGGPIKIILTVLSKWFEAKYS
jgi:hypothetical protein